MISPEPANKDRTHPEMTPAWRSESHSSGSMSRSGLSPPARQRDQPTGSRSAAHGEGVGIATLVPDWTLMAEAKYSSPNTCRLGHRGLIEPASVCRARRSSWPAMELASVGTARRVVL